MFDWLLNTPVRTASSRLAYILRFCFIHMYVHYIIVFFYICDYIRCKPTQKSYKEKGKYSKMFQNKTKIDNNQEFDGPPLKGKILIQQHLKTTQIKWTIHKFPITLNFLQYKWVYEKKPLPRLKLIQLERLSM